MPHGETMSRFQLAPSPLAESIVDMSAIIDRYSVSLMDLMASAEEVQPELQEWHLRAAWELVRGLRATINQFDPELQTGLNREGLE
jgi:hypothetical protein